MIRVDHGQSGNYSEPEVPLGQTVDRKVGPRPRLYMQVKADRLRTGQSAGKARHGGLPDAGD